MTDWGGGYVTDIAYQPGYYPEQSPWHLAVCATMAGCAVDWPGADDPVRYLELGCGLGYGALVLAAANPTWIVTAIDFNPGHIAAATRMAAQAGIGNVRYVEADLANLADGPGLAEIPVADVVSLHGVWSWVAPEVRSGIVRLLKARVRPGGIVHVTYNALPAWQGAVGLQRLVREAGRRQASRSDRQVMAGLATAKALAEAGAHNIARSPLAAGMLDRFANSQTSYLAHELMNACWSPCFHADVAEALAEARLDWVGSAHMTENFAELTLDAAQRAEAAKSDDPMFKELVKDLCLSRGLRSDIFVRGAVRIGAGRRDAALAEVALALAAPADEFRFSADLPAGAVTMNEEVYGVLVRRLAAEGAVRVGALLQTPELGGRGRNPAEVIAMLTQGGQAELVARPGLPADARAQRLNAVAARHYVDRAALETPSAVASPALGGGLRVTGLEMFLLDRIAAVGGFLDAAIWARELGPELQEDQAEQLAEVIRTVVAKRAAVWRVAGLA